MNAFKNWMRLAKRHRALLFLIILVALLRWGRLHGSTLEWDEANLLAIAKLGSIGDIIRVTAIRELHPPALTLMLSTWIGLFGDSDFWVRNFTGFWGVVGLMTAYGLAFEVSGSRLTAWVTAALCGLSPWLVHYSSITTFYAPQFALTLASWWLFLRALRAEHPRSWLVAYVVVTVVTCYLIVTAGVVLLSQAAYLIWAWYQQKPLNRRWVLVAIAVSGLVFLPWAWIVMQPWHLSHTAKLPYHQLPSIGMFLYGPVNLLFLGYDTREFNQMPPLPILTGYGLLGFGLLAASIRMLVRHREWPEAINHPLWLLICVAVLPPVLIYGLGALTGTGVFQFRTVLFALFGLHFVLAFWLTHQHSWKLAVAVFLIITGVQAFSPHKRPYWPDVGNVLAENVKAGFEKGDGIVVSPGWMSLVFLRYFDPEHFGLSPHERNFDPTRENYFNMVQRTDDRYFMVSGAEQWARPEIRQAFAQFQAEHKRLWMLVDSSEIMAIEPALNCQPIYMILQPGGTFAPATCQLSSTAR